MGNAVNQKDVKKSSKKKSREELVIVTDEIGDAVRYLNERTILSGLELAKEVGEHVLETFFDGDYTIFENPSRSKATSFRALLEREDLLLGKATVYSFVRISHQLKSLPTGVATRLSLTQQRALLPLQEPEHKAAMARRALEEGWSGTVLAAKVREERPRSRTGRRPVPVVVKGVQGVVKALDVAFEGDGEPRVEELAAEGDLQILLVVEIGRCGLTQDLGPGPVESPGGGVEPLDEVLGHAGCNLGHLDSDGR
jgi:hypothetical protein